MLVRNGVAGLFCSYDRQRGINITAPKDQENTEEQLVSLKQQNNHEVKAKDSRRSGGGAIGSNVEGGNQGGMLAPCCEGGATDAGSVGGILARSLGNTVTARRRRMPEGGGKGRGSIPGSNQDKEGSAPQSRWRSWNEPPPRALLTAEEIRSASAAKTADERRRQPPPSEVIAEIMPPFRSRRRSRTPSGSSTASDEKRKHAEHVAGVSLASGEGEKRRDRCNGEGLVSTTTADRSSSRRTAAGGGSLVPRVATLATPPTAEKNKMGTIKKGKDFDPDQLECVRRHEASIAEKERMVHSIRKEAVKRTVFRARPLPAFLDSDDAASGSAGDLTSKGGGDARGKGDKSGRGSTAGTGLGAAGTRPELLAALEQVTGENSQDSWVFRPVSISGCSILRRARMAGRRPVGQAHVGVNVSIENLYRWKMHNTTPHLGHVPMNLCAHDPFVKIPGRGGASVG